MKSKHLLVRSVLLYGIVLVFCAGVFIASGSQARASQVISLGDSGLWGNGWAWLSSDGTSVCMSSSCCRLDGSRCAFTVDLSFLPTTQPGSGGLPGTTAEPEPTAVPDVLGAVPVKGQTKYVSCELRTTANNVEWYYLYRVGLAVEQALPEGYADFEAYFIDSVGTHCNPNRGFRGDINGRFVTACDPSAGGYGVYPKPIEAGLEALGIPYQTLYLEVNPDNARALKDVFANAYRNKQVLSLWVRQIVDAPLIWEEDPETGERYPIATHEHAVSGQVVRASDGSLQMLVVDPWPMFSGLRYQLTFDEIIDWMDNLGLYMLQIIG